MKRFENKVVLVTGSSRGIGKAVALLFAKEGANVVVNYLTSDKEAEGVVTEIKKIGSQAIAIKCDVSKEEEVVEMINKAINHFVEIDILVNNAGIANDVPILERTVENWGRTLDVNVLGQFLCIKHVSSNMIKAGKGKIINISSTSALYSSSPDIVDYDVSKAGVLALTKDVAKALAPNIQVNVVAPGWVETDINKDLSKDFINKELENIYLKRFAMPEEIAKVVLFLASDEASFITGSTIVVDGGHD